MAGKEIKGIVYRVKHLTGGWLVEVPEDKDPIEELAQFVADRAAQGYTISSVTRIFDCSSDTPRIAVLSSPEYKAARKRLAETANQV